ncbi:hypothetical protein FRC02_011196 [Tulasnella sp. 418]|nr:hypothetical protein FRC02_011196 [Tulasnella sp. 418]
MDNIQSDEELVEEMKPIANKLHIKPQVAVAILLVIIIVLCILLAVGTWYFHKRYHRKQQEFAEKIIQETKQSKYASISPPILPPVHYSTMNERSLARVSVPGQVISPRTPNYEELQIDTSRLARLSGASRHTRRRSGESFNQREHLGFVPRLISSDIPTEPYVN